MEKKHFIIFLLLLFTKTATAQISAEQYKAVLIQHVSNLVIWPNEDSLKVFRIGYIGNNENMYNEIVRSVSKVKIKKKNVEVVRIKELSKIKNIQVLYVADDNNYEDKEIYEAFQKKNILMFTENWTDPRYILINIKPVVSNKVDFEINKANIAIENLTTMPDLILLKGQEINIRDLFLEQKKNIDETQKEINRQKLINDSLSHQIAQQNQTVNTLKKNTDSLNILRNKSENKLNYLSDSIIIQGNILKAKISDIIKLENELVNKESNISNKDLEILLMEDNLFTQKILLDSLTRLSEQKQKEVNDQNFFLKVKDEQLESKNRSLLFFAAFLFVLFVSFVFVIIFYNIKRKHNIELEEKVRKRTAELKMHQDHLEDLVTIRTKELQDSYKQLDVFNKTLTNQKEVLEKTLQELKSTQDQLIQSEKMASIGILTAGVAHEINNPINFISSGISGLKKMLAKILDALALYRTIYKNSTDEKITEFEKTFDSIFIVEATNDMINNIETGTERTKQIVKSLKSFARSDDNILKATDLHESIDSNLLMLHNQYKNRIEIVRNYSKLPPVDCYSAKISQVFMNILMNAIQAIPEKGKVTISTKVKGEFAEISIKDTGNGISEEVQKKIFDPSFTTKDVGEGTGLGLSIVYGIIKQHNGEIKLNSTIGVGTEFIITLPIKQSETIKS